MAPKVKIVKREKSAPKPKTVTLTEDLLEARLEEAREEERAKLSQTILDNEKRIRLLRTKLKKRKNGSGLSEEELVTQAVRVAKKELRKEQDKLLNKVGELEQQQLSVQLGKIKRRIIAEYDGQVIPGMIHGEDEEELRVSAVNANKAWIAAVKSAGVEVEEDEETEEEEEELEDEDEEEDEEDVMRGLHRKKFKKSATQVAPNPQPVESRFQRVVPARIPYPGSGGGKHRSDPLSTLKGVKGLSLTDYRANRANILAAARDYAATSGGMT